MSERVCVGMSGGVDSSVAAALLLEKGFDVFGIHLLLNDHDDESTKDAEKVADKLGIELITADFREYFRENIIDSFAQEYRNGRTPNPCVVCNRLVKFGKMFELAEENRADLIATGHYANTKKTEKGTLLIKADSPKDQSYFLNQIKKEILPYIIFPVNEFSKSETRATAEKISLPTAEKKDSQEICFIRNESYRSFLEREYNIVTKPGDFLDIDGNVIGKHSGVLNYTIGQRKGIGAFGKPMFVTSINAADNTVVLAENGMQTVKEIIAENMNWLTDPIEASAEYTVKIRAAAAPKKAEVRPVDKNSVVISFEEPVRAAAPGQYAVLYREEVLVGGGKIKNF